METPTEIHSSAHGAPLAGRAACGRDRGHTTTPIPPRAPMSVFVWAMIGVALRSHSVLVPDRFCGGIIGALVAAVAGALVSCYLLPSPGVPTDNPPRVTTAQWPIPGPIIALFGTYLYGARRKRLQARRR